MGENMANAHICIDSDTGFAIWKSSLLHTETIVFTSQLSNLSESWNIIKHGCTAGANKVATVILQVAQDRAQASHQRILRPGLTPYGDKLES